MCIGKIADKYSLWIIEDACHAPGGFFKDSNDINEKTQNEWEMVTEDGTPFTIYDNKTKEKVQL